jgi:hypothetical protein
VLAALPTQVDDDDDVVVEVDVVVEDGIYCTVASAYWLVLSAIVVFVAAVLL